MIPQVLPIARVVLPPTPAELLTLLLQELETAPLGGAVADVVVITTQDRGNWLPYLVRVDLGRTGSKATSLAWAPSTRTLWRTTTASSIRNTLRADASGLTSRDGWEAVWAVGWSSPRRGAACGTRAKAA